LALCSVIGVSVDEPDGIAGEAPGVGVAALGSAAGGGLAAGACVSTGGAVVVGVSVGVVCATDSAIAPTREAATAEVMVNFNALMLALLARAVVDVGAEPEDPVTQD